MLKRRRFKQQLTLQDRLSAWVKQVKEDAARLPPGPERDALLKKARQALDLPDLNYDKEALVGLIGRILHRWPELRRPREQPVVHRRGVAGVSA